LHAPITQSAHSVARPQVGWLIGRAGKTFKDLQEKTKVTRLNVDKTMNQVVLVGTKSAVEAAQLYMDTHLQVASCQIPFDPALVD
jgi:hypothetical protein